MNLLQVAINAQNCYVKNYVYRNNKMLELHQTNGTHSKDWSNEPFNKCFLFVFKMNKARNKIITMVWSSTGGWPRS